MANETANPPPALRREPMTATQALLALLVAGVCGVGLLWSGVSEAFSPTGQWDFEAYYYAVKVQDAGGDPWDHAQVVKMAEGAVNHLMYPPHTLPFFRLFAFDDLRLAKDAFLAAKLGCLAALLILWLSVFVRAGARGWFLAFAALGYNTAICRDLVAGNISLFEQALIWFAVWALLHGRLSLFCLLIILAGQFKALPLVLLSLVLLTDSPRKWHCFLGSIAACLFIAAGVYLWDPVGSRAFVSLMSDVAFMEPGGVINPSSRTLIADIAAAVARASELFDEVAVRRQVYPIYVAYALAGLGFFIAVMRRHDLRTRVFLALLTYALAGLSFFIAVMRRHDLQTRVFLALLTYAVIAPRMKDYSYILVVVPTFELIRERLARGGSVRWLVVGVAGLLALPGLDVLWPYRALLLAGWVWAMSLGGERKTVAS